ncbi:MAG: hypothetical protein A2X56_07595 [Nitrospirae bacterium GWC2_57_13]|nr:MAG: hypothetical protein A2072_07030 [Nitrospirae bacterium GWC1_57_7]OGW28445.1 MAG: hypothetical protein A2X56_07595 [Nitrospirae bacterium GWC2_57_13]OGW44059.1 MAG: hypothetical protein A2X57_04205 [Nitrospirae bacterium GWD2_57_8]
MKKTLAIAVLATLLTGCTIMKVYLRDELQPLEERIVSGTGREKILLLDISGTISNRESGSLLGDGKEPGMLSRLREELDRAAADTAVKALVIRINSPGGTVSASDMLHHELLAFKRRTGIPVVAHMMDVATSGAYYAVLAADRITAQPTTVTGSIGVVMYRIDATGLMQKIGIQAVEIASGERKGMGSPFREMAPAEKNIFQKVINELHGRFVDIIAESRHMPRDRVVPLADGRIFTSREAKEAGLIDDVGYLEDAIAAAQQLAKVREASVVRYTRPGEYRANIYSMSLINVNLGDLVDPGMHFLYVWWP